MPWTPHHVVLWLGVFLLPSFTSCEGAQNYWEVEQVEFIGTLASSLGLVHGNWDTGEVEAIMSDFTTETGGAMGITVDLKEDGSAREMLVGARNKNVYTCPMEANAVADCDLVGACGSVVPRHVAYDKDAAGNVIGYFLACSDLVYCDTTGAESCSTWIGSSHSSFSFQQELAANGTTIGVFFTVKWGVKHCTYPDAECVIKFGEQGTQGASLGMSLAEKLKCIQTMDYSDSQVLQRWTTSLRTNALGIAPVTHDSICYTFASHIFSGHVLSYTNPSDGPADPETNRRRSMRALEIQKRWAAVEEESPP